MTFFVFQCKNCGRWGSKQVLKIGSSRFKCFYCNKSFKVKKKSGYGLNLNYKTGFNSLWDAVRTCQGLNGLKKEEKENV